MVVPTSDRAVAGICVVGGHLLVHGPAGRRNGRGHTAAVPLSPRTLDWAATGDSVRTGLEPDRRFNRKTAMTFDVCRLAACFYSAPFSRQSGHRPLALRRR